MEIVKRKRIESIDLLRGLVMILMALDHSRQYFNYGSFFSEPTNLDTTTPALFFTRWITHFCAPVFVFLAGTSAFLYGTRRKNTKEVSWFLFSRGLWLVFIEITVVTFGWNFDITWSAIILQVIWAIGASMIFLSFMVYLPKKYILIIGLIIVFGHNFLDSLSGVLAPRYFSSVSPTGTNLKEFIWFALHQKNFIMYSPDFTVNIVYPIIPWIGVMALGFIFGGLYQKEYDAQIRKKWLLWLGIGSIVLFLVLRAFNIYGDPKPWEIQDTFIYSVMSFFNANKYPVSLQFLLMTLGPAFLFLLVTENLKNIVAKSVIVFGRVPFFFYVIHIYTLHLLGAFGLMYAGKNWSDTILNAHAFVTGSLADTGYSLPVVYAFWIIVIVGLFPLCKWYNNYKANNRDKWWLSYL